MAALQARIAHIRDCGRCAADRAGCRAGEQLHDEFVRVQDQYLAAQKKRTD
ncbi:hypothetical protein [Streptomyces uncialis]|uniref:hypothetical protein n=1 Tax=Streptomyces uncialis TaxID=1048205 RepID=UPI0037A0F3C3